MGASRWATEMTLARDRRLTSHARSAARKASPTTNTPPGKYRTTWRGSTPQTMTSAVGTPPRVRRVTVTSAGSGCAHPTLVAVAVARRHRCRRPRPTASGWRRWSLVAHCSCSFSVGSGFAPHQPADDASTPAAAVTGARRRHSRGRAGSTPSARRRRLAGRASVGRDRPPRWHPCGVRWRPRANAIHDRPTNSSHLVAGREDGRQGRVVAVHRVRGSLVPVGHALLPRGRADAQGP